MRGLRTIVVMTGAALSASCAGRSAPGRAAPTGSGPARPVVSLAGEWQLDVRSARRLVPERGPMRMGAGRDSLLRRDSLVRDSLRAEFGRLVIAQADSALTFTQGRRAPLVVYTDWRETRIPGRHGPGDVTFVTGQWVGSRFEVRRVLPSRTAVVERFELSRDGRRLLVTTRIAERGRERGEILPREVTRVYARAAAAP